MFMFLRKVTHRRGCGPHFNTVKQFDKCKTTNKTRQYAMVRHRDKPGIESWIVEETIVVVW
jgi:hypothetical protein